jgi:hypothetical protein
LKDLTTKAVEVCEKPKKIRKEHSLEAAIHAAESLVDDPSLRVEEYEDTKKIFKSHLDGKNYQFL